MKVVGRVFVIEIINVFNAQDCALGTSDTTEQIDIILRFHIGEFIQAMKMSFGRHDHHPGKRVSKILMGMEELGFEDRPTERLLVALNNCTT